uniref:Venom peroxidase n=1 Tax=Lethocerus distinctifemur TaxID=280095 RepID=A0A2K8JLR7_9HEMI|nr:venom peroxidase [Lethocerus distinctifemur]
MYHNPLLPLLLALLGNWADLVRCQLLRVEGNDAGADTCYRAPRCDPNYRYRTVDGSCNNLLFPNWGQARTHYIRLLPAMYSDGNSLLRSSRRGGALPNVRKIRTDLFPDVYIEDPVNTLAVMEWGQSVAHDAMRTNDQADGDCCASGNQLPGRPAAGCMPIPIPANDTFYSRYNIRCQSYSRSVTTNGIGCPRSPQQQVNWVTHFLDVSIVYGSDPNVASSLREFRGGQMRVASNGQSGPTLPFVRRPLPGCDITSPNQLCFLAGDDRVNQNPQIGALSMMLVREHNRIAKELAYMNPYWNDETLYQEARRILIAVFQHITYNEYLPAILATPYYKGLGLEPLQYGYSSSYGVRINPGTINSFVSAVWRSFHNTIQGFTSLMEEKRCPFATLRLSDVLFVNGNIVTSSYEGILRGLATQPERAYTRYFTEEITNFFNKSRRPFGTDLEVTDMTRGRDHGLPPYNEFRALCGLPRARSFADLHDVIKPENVNRLTQLYGDVNDVDLFVGGVLEVPVPGGMTGPTFQCIISQQFSRWKHGDRFFYEHGNQAGTFTPAQLSAIKKTTLSSLFCLNSNIQVMQPRAFLLPSRRNPLIPCNKITHLDLSPWKSR